MTPTTAASSGDRELRADHLKAALNHARSEGKMSCPDDAWSAVKPFRDIDQPKVRYLLDEPALPPAGRLFTPDEVG